MILLVSVHLSLLVPAVMISSCVIFTGANLKR